VNALTLAGEVDQGRRGGRRTTWKSTSEWAPASGTTEENVRGYRLNAIDA